MQRRTVDLPEPLGPMMLQISPLAFSRSMSLRTVLGPKDFRIFWARIVPSLLIGGYLLPVLSALLFSLSGGAGRLYGSISARAWTAGSSAAGSSPGTRGWRRAEAGWSRRCGRRSAGRFGAVRQRRAH